VASISTFVPKPRSRRSETLQALPHPPRPRQRFRKHRRHGRMPASPAASMGFRERLGDSASAFNEELPRQADCRLLQCDDPGRPVRSSSRGVCRSSAERTPNAPFKKRPVAGERCRFEVNRLSAMRGPSRFARRYAQPRTNA
jgi:hypothetical protein